MDNPLSIYWSKNNYAKKRAMMIFERMNTKLPKPLYVIGDGQHEFIREIIFAITDEVVSINQTGKPKYPKIDELYARINKIIENRENKDE